MYEMSNGTRIGRVIFKTLITIAILFALIYGGNKLLGIFEDGYQSMKAFTTYSSNQNNAVNDYITDVDDAFEAAGYDIPSDTRKECPNCHKMNSNKNMYCTQCGNKIGDVK